MLKKLYALHESKPEFPLPPELRVVICGMPRGGTTYTANMLNQFIPTGHETIFGNVRVNDPPLRSVVVDVTGFAIPWVPFLKSQGVKIVHLIRHPLKCCTSFSNYFNAGEQHVSWEDTCDMYYKVHNMLDSLADVGVVLEKWHEYIEFVEELLSPVKFGEYQEVNHSPSSWTEPRRSWGELPQWLRVYAKSWGYGPD